MPEIHDIGEEHTGMGWRLPHSLGPWTVCGPLSRRTSRSMLAPWRPFGQYQHLIVWIDLTGPESEDVIRYALRGVDDQGPQTKDTHAASE